jgi:hypothetical protein
MQAGQGSDGGGVGVRTSALTHTPTHAHARRPTRPSRQSTPHRCCTLGVAPKMVKYEKNRSTRRSTPRHPIAMASTAKPPDPMPCALAAILLPESRARAPAIYGKPCFQGPTGCMRGAGAFGPFLRTGCAGAVWVRGGSLGSCMRAGRRCLAPLVGGVRWSGSPSRHADTRARCAAGHVGGWATLCLPAVRGRACIGAWAGAASAGSFGLLRWSQSGAYRC